MPHFEFAESGHGSGNDELNRGENPSRHSGGTPYPHPMQRAHLIPSITTTPEQPPAR